MNKPLVLLPFIYVYKMVSFIFKVIFSIIRYTALGFFFINITIITIIVNTIYNFTKFFLLGFIFISYILYNILFVKFIYYVLLGLKWLLKNIGYGILYLCYSVYRFLRYIVLGIVFPFVLIYNFIGLGLSQYRIIIDKLKEKNEMKRKKRETLIEEKRKEKERIAEIRKKEQIELLAQKEKAKEEAAKRKQEEINKKKKKEEDYINEKVKIEKKSFGDKINDFLERFAKSPVNIKKYFIDKYNNLSFVKNAKNKLDINRQALLINFESEDAVKSDTKIMYEYVGKDPEGKIIKGHVEAFSKVEVHSFLLSEGYEVYSIRSNKWITFLYGRASVNSTKIKNKDLIFFLTQLSTYVKAGIPLVDSLKILTRQYRQKSYQRIFKTIIYDLTMGESFSTALDKQGVAFPRLLINMVKASEMTGELPEVLDDMAEYFTEIEKTRKQMITAMIYPSIVFIMSIAVITFIIMFVIPKFIEIYQNMDADQIPVFTRLVIAASDFLEDNIIWMFLGFALTVLVIHYLYKNVRILRAMMQWFIMHIPVFGKIVIYNEVTVFTKTFSSLLSHNVFITQSMEVLNKITNNEIYKMMILDTISNLGRGERLSAAFEGHWAFPIPAYEMIVTGEKTGQLAEMMKKVSDYYQDLHKNAVTRLKTLVEPALIVFLTFVVGAIILAVIIPMFSTFTMIK